MQLKLIFVFFVLLSFTLGIRNRFGNHARNKKMKVGLKSLKNKQYRISVTNTVAVNGCRQYSAGVNVCVINSNCGWCKTSNRCIEGSQNGPSRINECPIFDNFIFDMPTGMNPIKFSLFKYSHIFIIHVHIYMLKTIWILFVLFCFCKIIRLYDIYQHLVFLVLFF